MGEGDNNGGGGQWGSNDCTNTVHKHKHKDDNEDEKKNRNFIMIMSGKSKFLKMYNLSNIRFQNSNETYARICIFYIINFVNIFECCYFFFNLHI